MKGFGLIVLFSFLMAGAIAQPVIKFDKTVQRLGFVTKEDTLHFQYTFTNTGDQPLIISDTKVQCGCTIVQKPDVPVLPGKQGIIYATFITTGAIDRQDRTIIVTCNASNSPVELRFKCVVLKSNKKS